MKKNDKVARLRQKLYRQGCIFKTPNASHAGALSQCHFDSSASAQRLLALGSAQHAWRSNVHVDLLTALRHAASSVQVHERGKFAKHVVD